jgi:hypothetical protein
MLASADARATNHLVLDFKKLAFAQKIAKKQTCICAKN